MRIRYAAGTASSALSGAALHAGAACCQWSGLFSDSAAHVGTGFLLGSLLIGSMGLCTLLRERRRNAAEERHASRMRRWISGDREMLKKIADRTNPMQAEAERREALQMLDDNAAERGGGYSAHLASIVCRNRVLRPDGSPVPLDDTDIYDHEVCLYACLRNYRAIAAVDRMAAVGNHARPWWRLPREGSSGFGRPPAAEHREAEARGFEASQPPVAYGSVRAAGGGRRRRRGRR